MSAPSLFKYQQEAIEFINAAGGSLILGDETGVGKTPTAVRYCADNHLYTLIVCPASLKRQWQRECQRFAPDFAAVILGEDSILPNGWGFVITNYDQLDKWRDYLDDFDAVILDECFPWDTPVLTDQGPLPIGMIVDQHLPVSVMSRNMTTGVYEWKPIIGYLEKQSVSWVRVVHEGGSFVCTPNHKIWTEEDGYVVAAQLQASHHLRMVRGERGQDGVPLDEEHTVLREVMLGQMAHCPAGGAGSTEREDEGQAGNTDGATESRGVQAYAREQSDVQPRNCGEDAGEHEGPNLPVARGQWDTNAATDRGSRILVPADGVPDPHGDGARSIPLAAEFVQGGRGRSCDDDGYRSGRQVASAQEVAVSGLAQNFRADCVGVVCVEVYERGSYGEFVWCGGVDTRAYDIEVADNHNYIAAGVLVSNCQLIKTYLPGKAGKKHKDSSLRAHLVHTLLGDIPHKLLLTGTAIKSRPGELWSLLHFLDPYRWPDPWKYGAKMGYITEKEVWIPGGKKKKVRALDGVGDTRKVNLDIQDVYLRRTKHEVRADMPPKLRSTLTLDLPPQAAQEYRRLERQWLSQQMQGSHLAALSELRHRCAEWKVTALDEFITGLVNEGQKVVVFSSFHSPLDLVSKRWVDDVARLDGTMSQMQRDWAVKEFMQNQASIFAIQTQAGGVGLNLNHPDCSTVVFLDLPWTPADVLQCEDRIWRITNEHPITSVRPVFAGTAEEHVLDLITKKEAVLAQVLEGRSALDVTELETSVLDDLLALYRTRRAT